MVSEGGAKTWLEVLSKKLEVPFVMSPLSDFHTFSRRCLKSEQAKEASEVCLGCNSLAINTALRAPASFDAPVFLLA